MVSVMAPFRRTTNAHTDVPPAGIRKSVSLALLPRILSYRQKITLQHCIPPLPKNVIWKGANLILKVGDMR